MYYLILMGGYVWIFWDTLFENEDIHSFEFDGKKPKIPFYVISMIFIVISFVLVHKNKVRIL